MTINQGSPRILITRLSAIGDCITTLPMLSALRRHLPNAHLAWAMERGPATLLDGHPELDELIVMPKDWLKSPGFAWALRRQLRARRFDIAIDPQSLMKSATLAWLSGARIRAGFAPPRGRELAPWLNNRRRKDPRDHVVDAQLDLLSVIGIEDHTVEFRFPDRTAIAGPIGQFLDSEVGRTRFVTVNSGAGWDSKLWPPERFGRVAEYLGKFFGLPSIVVWAGDRERAWAEQIVATSGEHAILAPATTLPELEYILRRSLFYLGSDTGPMHLAAAVGRPCVALFGPTRPECCGPYGARHQCLQADDSAEGGSVRNAVPSRSMQNISVKAVCAACDRLLTEHGKPATNRLRVWRYRGLKTHGWARLLNRNMVARMERKRTRSTRDTQGSSTARVRDWHV